VNEVGGKLEAVSGFCKKCGEKGQGEGGAVGGRGRRQLLEAGVLVREMAAVNA